MIMPSEAAGAGYTYEPFGTMTWSGDTSNYFWFTGQLGTVRGSAYNFSYFRNRYYNSILQRFISKDPIGYAGGSLNLYTYVDNDPMNLTDPTGVSGGANGAGEGYRAPQGTFAYPEGISELGNVPANGIIRIQSLTPQGSPSPGEPYPGLPPIYPGPIPHPDLGPLPSPPKVEDFWDRNNPDNMPIYPVQPPAHFSSTPAPPDKSIGY